MSPLPRLWLTNVFKLIITPRIKLAGIKLIKLAGRIAASAVVPRRDTITLSTNCIIVKDMFVTTIGAANFSIYLSEVSSKVCSS